MLDFEPLYNSIGNTKQCQNVVNRISAAVGDITKDYLPVSVLFDLLIILRFTGCSSHIWPDGWKKRCQSHSHDFSQR